eukprot:835467-Rhodomonas_salina.3
MVIRREIKYKKPQLQCNAGWASGEVQARKRGLGLVLVVLKQRCGPCASSSARGPGSTRRERSRCDLLAQLLSVSLFSSACGVGRLSLLLVMILFVISVLFVIIIMMIVIIIASTMTSTVTPSNNTDPPPPPHAPPPCPLPSSNKFLGSRV